MMCSRQAYWYQLAMSVTGVRPLLAILLAVIICIALFLAKDVVYVFQETQSRISQRTVHEQIYKEYLRPATLWVKEFQTNHERLPSQEEFANGFPAPRPYQQALIYDKPFSDGTWGQLGVDFVLCVHFQDWNLYYRSSDQTEFKYWTD
jgi:hypothetical protein